MLLYNVTFYCSAVSKTISSFSFFKQIIGGEIYKPRKTIDARVGDLKRSYHTPLQKYQQPPKPTVSEEGKLCKNPKPHSGDPKKSLSIRIQPPTFHQHREPKHDLNLHLGGCNVGRLWGSTLCFSNSRRACPHL